MRMSNAALARVWRVLCRERAVTGTPVWELVERAQLCAVEKGLTPEEYLLSYYCHRDYEGLAGIDEGL